MKQRMITGLLGGVLFITLVYLGGIWYSLLILLLAMVGLFEFLRMAHLRPFGIAGLLSYLLMLSILWPELISADMALFQFSNLLIPVLLLLLFYTVIRKNEFHIEHVALAILGALYLGYGFLYMAAFRDGMSQHGFWLTMLVLLGIWSTDSGAYFVGRAIGKNKLWPAISPNKTIEGSIGGLAAALIVVLGINAVQGIIPFTQALAIALVTGIAAQMGDLVESALKRHFGVKDSGRIFPGHGGVLDRFDSLIIVFPILYLLGLHTA
ncbi:phosphatidate cytidylyltransferase [Brevibacillus sp. SYSU BS000544]|uniref:phosphatidate cytidylyltransferase n=1 Tax=Brevibacillus sp. SYSU BS000544 TaxID=3416443 RepID=UPI003CE4C96B